MCLHASVERIVGGTTAGEGVGPLVQTLRHQILYSRLSGRVGVVGARWGAYLEQEHQPDSDSDRLSHSGVPNLQLLRYTPAGKPTSP
jgi:hypothetical protein